jgi:peptidylprolyl isomerase
MSNKIAKEGKTVRVHYTGKFEDGTVFDTTDGKDPFTCVIGSEELIPGFNKALEEMKEGESKNVTISPEDGFGEYHDYLILDIPIAQLPENASEGDFLEDEKTGMQWFIKSKNDEQATLDGNHSLAGKVLHFNLELIEITN